MRSIGILIIVFGVLSACSSDAVVEYLVRDTVGCVTGNGCLAVDVATNVVEYAHDQMKSDTLYSNTSKSTTSSRYCKRNDDSVYGSKFCSVSHTQITKAEYNRLKGKTVTASKSTTPSSKATYCKRRDGTVYIHRSNSSRSLRDCHVAITKAEYDRLTGKTTVTASKSTTKLGYLHCKRSDGTVYRTERDVCGISGGRISKTEYDRLKGKKTVSKYIKNFKNTFCKGNSGAVYSSVRQCGAGHKEITKAEHDRLARGGTVTASKSSTSSGKTVYCRSPSGNVYRSNRE
ncbi:MAG: hypothetical protein CMO98_13330, partial [Woeseia sp.]|nr:hypothetical protein [Woeseia sp.]